MKSKRVACTLTLEFEHEITDENLEELTQDFNKEMCSIGFGLYSNWVESFSTDVSRVCEDQDLVLVPRTMLVDAAEAAEDLSNEWEWRRDTTQKNNYEMSELDNLISALRSYTTKH